MLKRLGIILTIAVLVVLALQSQVAAQATVNLQADVNRLRQQVYQLQSQVSQLRRATGTSSTPPAPRRNQRSPELTDQEMIDRLATLAIEAKDRLNALEARVARLEGRTQ